MLKLKSYKKERSGYMNKILNISVSPNLIEFTFESDYIANIYSTRLHPFIRLNYGTDKEVYSKNNKLCVSGNCSCDAVEYIKQEINNIKCVF